MKTKQAAVALIIKDGLILSINRRNDKTKYGLIGGKVDLGETLSSALIREVKEESNINVINYSLIYSRVEPGGLDGIDYTTYCYYIDSWSGLPSSSDEGDLKWLSQSELTGANGAFPKYNTDTLNVFKNKFPNVFLI